MAVAFSVKKLAKAATEYFLLSVCGAADLITVISSFGRVEAGCERRRQQLAIHETDRVARFV